MFTMDRSERSRSAETRKKIARVALARRLAGILFAMLRDGTTYRPRPGRGHDRRATTAVPLR
jgi:hypothetical protein